MRDPERIKPFLAALEKVWMSNPDFRFGQLVTAITRTGEINPRLFYMEEEELLEKVEEFERIMASR